MILPLQPGRVEQVQAALREELEEQQAPPINIENTLALFGAQRFPFRGREYEVRPIPFDAGLQLLAAQHALESVQRKAATAENLATMRGALAVAADLFPRLMRRRGLLRFLPVRCPGNMTEGEALTILGFWLGCRMIGLAAPSLGASLARQPTT